MTPDEIRMRMPHPGVGMKYPPDKGDYQAATELVWNADPSTSSFRDDDETGPYELTRPRDYDDDPDALRPILVALLQRLQSEYGDAPVAYQIRVTNALRERLAKAPKRFAERDEFTAVLTIFYAIATGRDPKIIVATMIDRRLVHCTAVAAEMIVGLIGTEGERVANGQPADPWVIID